MKMFKVKTLRQEYLFADVVSAYAVYAAIADEGITVQLMVLTETGDFSTELTAN